jgi:molybdopterin-binding protein
MKLSSRNIIKGKVKKVNHGLVNSEVIVGLPNELEIVSIITKAAVENLNLKEGKEVYAIINAADVILATDY